MIERIWIYEGYCQRVVDGDTIVADIDQGMSHWAIKQYIRLAGINAPELSNPDGSGQLAKQYMETLLAAGTGIWLATVEYHEFEKYGRVLAVIYTAPPSSIPWAGADLATILPGSINQEMIDSGHAVAYDPSHL